MNQQHERDTYVIPPNFVETGTFFGGMLKARNVIEAGILGAAVGIPVFLYLPFSLTARIIILCLTALPLAMLAIIGIAGESLSSFLIIFAQYLRNRRIVGAGGEAKREKPWVRPGKGPAPENKPVKRDEKRTVKDTGRGINHDGHGQKGTVKTSLKADLNRCNGRMGGYKGRGDFPEEFGQVKGYELRRKLRPVPGQKPALKRSAGNMGDGNMASGKGKCEKGDKGKGEWKKGGVKKGSANWNGIKKDVLKNDPTKIGSAKKENRKKKGGGRENAARKRSRLPAGQEQVLLNPVAGYLPIEKIANGIIYTKDRRYVKIVEVMPINFLLRSVGEQRGIIHSFISYLKISPVKLQFKVLTRKADIGRHMETVRREMAQEENPQCRLMQEDYLKFIRQVGSREAVTRRFFLIFEYEPWNARRAGEEAEATAALQAAVHTAANYLRQCGNEAILPENEDEHTADILYNLLCRNESAVKPLPVKVKEVVAGYVAAGREAELDSIPAGEFFAPGRIDFTHGSHVEVDGLYYGYLFIPSGGYRTQVPAGWLSLIVNAGDGIDLDMFLARQPKERVVQKVGQQLRINRSRIKDASDTNTDFDDIDGAIQSGYFLKQGLADNEDFYFMNLLVTVTAPSKEELEWKASEMKKLLLSQDMEACNCHFREEQAFLSSLPLVHMEKKLYGRSRRNLLTSGAASCYPYTSYEMCDDNGILLGVNKYNSSLIIVDIFNTAAYKNANMAILGTSGAGKTFTMQLMALRMRRKGIQVFILAPLKGHEFHRACANVGGEFIQISPASPGCINVMEIRKIDRTVSKLLDGPGVQLSELSGKIQRLHIFFSLLIPDISHEERQLLDEALVRTYNGKGITHDNTTLENPGRPGEYKEMPVLEDLYNILILSAETRRLANILNRLVHGSASTFSRQTNVSLDNKYTVLDISSLSGDMLTVGLFVALDFVWDRAKEDRTAEKAIYIDECWQLLSGASATGTRLAGDFVLEIFKTIRGYGGSAICASQDLNDFFSLDGGRFGKGIINNSKTKVILNLEDEEAERVQGTLHLSDAEVMEVTHFERGNGLISTNNNNIMVEFKASPLEKDLITTDRKELQELVRRKRQEKEGLT